MANVQQSPANNHKFRSLLSSIESNLPPAVFAAEANQILYPVNTIATRLINYPEKITNWEKMNQAIFFDVPKQIKNASEGVTTVSPLTNTLTKLSSLNKGFMCAMANNGATKTYRFLAQDKMQEGIQAMLKPTLQKKMNDKQIQSTAAGASGVATGVTERLIFHPLDTYKTQKQMSYAKMSGLYNGVGVGALRDGLSAGIFFGTYNVLYNTLAGYNYLPSMSKEKKETIDKLASATGSGVITSILTNPLNVVKTRIQSSGSSAGIVSTLKNSFEKEGLQTITNGNLFKNLSKAFEANKNSGFLATAANIYAKEGLAGFGKGLSVNVLQAPLRSALPFFAFLFAKKKWDDHQTKSKLVDTQKCKPVLAVTR